MKSTIRSIAELSGLSPATVDRALHNRAHVSPATRQRVLETARRVGYLPEAGATALPVDPAHLEFLIPVGSNEFLGDLARHLQDFAARLPLVASARVHRLAGLTAGDLLDGLERISPRTSGVGVVATDEPRSRELLRDLCQGDTRLVTIASDIPAVPRSAYVGVDNRAAGRLAGLLMGRLARASAARFAIFLGTHMYRGHEERVTGFRSILAEAFPAARLVRQIEVFEREPESYEATLRLLRGSPAIDGIYCAGGARAGIVRALEESGRAGDILLACHDLTAESRRFLLSGAVDFVIDQNARLVAEQAIIALLGSIASALPALTRKLVEPRVIFRENIPLV